MNKYPRTVSVIFGFLMIGFLLLSVLAMPWLIEQEWFRQWFPPFAVVFVVGTVIFIIGGVFYEEYQKNKKNTEEHHTE